MDEENRGCADGKTQAAKGVDVWSLQPKSFCLCFFPACVLSYIAADRLSKIKKLAYACGKIRLKDWILILFSLGFYMWACFDNVFRLVFYIVIVYLLALGVNHVKQKKYYVALRRETEAGASGEKRFYMSRIPFVLALALVVFCLVYFNYSNFLIHCWNKVFGDNIGAKSLMAPLGLSFITFSAISYLSDTYRGKATPGSFVDCLLYISFSPRSYPDPLSSGRIFSRRLKTEACACAYL